MTEDRERYTGTPEVPYNCECCHCKKIFMMLVVLILVFMAGIMVGSCCSKPYGGYYHTPYMAKHMKQAKHQKMRHNIPNVPFSAQNQAPSPYFPNDQIGGFVIEVDQAQ